MGTIQHSETLAVAYNAARVTTTLNGRSRGGWIRLGRVKGTAVAPYVIAIRQLKDGRYDLGCDCPHFVFRCRKAGKSCKHIEAVLTASRGSRCATGVSHKGSHQVWWYDAGKAFVSAIEAVTVAGDLGDEVWA